MATIKRIPEFIFRHFKSFILNTMKKASIKNKHYPDPGENACCDLNY